MINRRQLIVGATALAPVAGCAQLGTLIGDLPQYAHDIQNIATDLASVASDIAAIEGVPASVMAEVQTALATIKSIAAQIGAAVGGGSVVTNLVTSFASALTGIAGALGVHDGAAKTHGKIGTILQMALQILPSILAVAGVAMAGPPESDAAAARAWLAAMAGRA